MNYNEPLQVVLDYIENHLKTEIYTHELASLLGFSTAHFQRLFHDYTKMTIAQYIMRRKLQHAMYEMSQNKKNLEVAFEYGFNTYAGFYKAFKKEYGCSPRLYMQNIEVQRPQKFELSEKSFQIFSYHDLKQVLLHWNLPKQLKISHVDHKRRDRWLVNERYVLKYLTQATDVEKVIALTDLLTDENMTVPQLIPLPDGKKALYQFEGYFYLELSMPAYKATSLEHFYELGKRVGHIHNILQHYHPDYLTEEVNFETVLCEWAIPQIRNHMTTWHATLPYEFWDDYMSQFKGLKEQLPTQLIHRKLSINNLLVSDAHQIGVKNFELSERNFRLFDVCYLGTSLLAECFHDEVARAIWIEQFKTIISGYDAIGHLTPLEKENIMQMLLAVQFVFIAYLKDRSEDKQLLLTNVAMVSFIYEQRENFR